MAEFKAINTQAEFDEAIKARLERERSTIEKRYADYEELKQKAAQADAAQKREADYQKRISEAEEKARELEAKYGKAAEDQKKHETQAAELTRRAEAAEKALLKFRVANASGIPYEMAERLQGETEDELKKDAEGLGKFLAPAEPVPLRSNDPAPAAGGTTSTTAAYRSLLGGLMNGKDT